LNRNMYHRSFSFLAGQELGCGVSMKRKLASSLIVFVPSKEYNSAIGRPNL